MTDDHLNKEIAPAYYTLKILSGKWNLSILTVLCRNKIIRYNELKRQVIGITGTMLNQSLKELIEYGIVQRVQYNEVPPKVEYSLTEVGLELIPIYEQLELWGEKNLERKKAIKSIHTK
ncbi:winged helix-turn-helix transcriptional regulator [Alkalicoccobacillus plakortidis]|uniref:Helix-turn-helix transcriptional regulator n=1 Tax=Alkalicoccobacillus plakortidis TaxID=444060 RepID=A0ABT0XF29_9BACI|nr:helix-turn-helix domain-containing protein [Alkalicoccobacillus plakortidis]MCM2674506.1 helix-turn-helix transcriptional regulator [Alkalicoccobacillus plakortidis]